MLTLFKSRRKRFADSLVWPDESMSAVRKILRSVCGLSVPASEDSRLLSHLNERAKHLHLSPRTYLDYLLTHEGQTEVELLARDLDNHPGYLFHDLEQLAEVAHWLREKAWRLTDSSRLRVWIPDLHGGEDVATMALLLAECPEANRDGRDFVLTCSSRRQPGTAVDMPMRFTREQVAQVRTDWLHQHFVWGENGAHAMLSKSISERIESVAFDQVCRTTRTPFDAVICRRTLGSLTRPSQAELLQTIHTHLRPEGLIVLDRQRHGPALPASFARLSAGLFQHEPLAPTSPPCP